jgi:hypothetical protein
MEGANLAAGADAANRAVFTAVPLAVRARIHFIAAEARLRGRYGATYKHLDCV